MSLEQRLLELKEENSELRKDIDRLSELQMRHEHQDEIRAVKQDQLMAHIQLLTGNLKDYMNELHTASLKNTEDISKLESKHIKTSTKLNILYGILGAIGIAILGAAVEWLPSVMSALSKMK